MVASDLDRLAQSVRRALDRIDQLEAEKRRLVADNSVLQARTMGARGEVIVGGNGGKDTAELRDRMGNARQKVQRLIGLLEEFEERL